MSNNLFVNSLLLALSVYRCNCGGANLLLYSAKPRNIIVTSLAEESISDATLEHWSRS